MVYYPPAMHGRPQIQDIPRALRKTFDKAKLEYAELIRRTRWGESPIYICPCGASASISVVATYAFESLLGWPVVVRPAAIFQSYSSSLLHPRSTLLVISASGESSEALEMAHLARARGATLLALTNNPESQLARASQALILTHAEPGEDSPAIAACQHAALAYFACVAAQTLKRPSEALASLDQEFEKLPGHAEWALIHLAGAVRALAGELKTRARSWMVGGGFYYSCALQGARRMRELAALPSWGVEAAEFRPERRGSPESRDAVLFLSGSRSKLKRMVHRVASQARIAQTQVLAITDSDDRELGERSDLAVLIPPLSELVGSCLALFLVEWVAVETAYRN